MWNEQGFNWESHNHSWYVRLMGQANWFASLGITCVWLPPFTDSVSPQGYMPLDLYNLNSRYGSEDELRRCAHFCSPIAQLHTTCHKYMQGMTAAEMHAAIGFWLGVGAGVWQSCRVRG